MTSKFCTEIAGADMHCILDFKIDGINMNIMVEL